MTNHRGRVMLSAVKHLKQSLAQHDTRRCFAALSMTRSGRFFIFHSWWLLIYLLLLMVCVHLFVVYFEEPRLRRQFGENYQRYLRVVLR